MTNAPINHRMSAVRSLRAPLASMLAVAASLAGAARAATHLVPADFPTIQDAVNAAADGDEIVLANGIYGEDVTITNKVLTLRSGSNNPAACIIEPVFLGVAIIGADADVELRGLRIRNGARGVELNLDSSATIRNCQIRNHTISGLFMNGTRLEMRNSEVSGNSTTNAGGGLFIVNGAVLLSSCDIHDNDVSGANAYGGGIYAGNTDSLMIVECRIASNTAVGTSDGEGAGLYVTGSGGLTVSASTFEDNTAGTLGGGAYVEFTDAVFSNVEARGNTAEGGGGVFFQNLGSLDDHTLRMSNCLLALNDAGAGSGGGLRIGSDADAFVTNLTIFNNTASSGGGVANGPGSEASFTSCVVGGNTPNDFQGGGATTVTYSNVEDGFAGEGNISEVPLLADVANGDYHLTADSPMIDAGDTAAYLGFTVDLDGNERTVDEPAVANTGISMLSTAIDMGCYEFLVEDAPNECPADITGPGDAPDGNVDALDFLQLIASWGNPGCPM